MKYYWILGLALVFTACNSGEVEILEDELPQEPRTLCRCDELIVDPHYNKMHLGDPDVPFEGLCQLFHKGDQLSEERVYVDGKIEGYVKKWHENGQLASEFYFERNRQTGIAKMWDDEGNLTHHGRYEKGKQVEVLSVDQDSLNSSNAN